MTDPIADAAHAFLRRHTRGELRFDEHLRPLKFVIGPEGQLAAPLMVAMIEAVDAVLFLPEWKEGAMEVQVTIEPFEEHGPQGSRGALADRWRIYHGEPEDFHWAMLDPDAARFEGNVIDGAALVRQNPFAPQEASLCRAFNQDRKDDLRALAHHFAKIEIEDPVMVGIDPLGLDVRARFDVIRVDAPERMETIEDAKRVLERMVSVAKAQGT